MRFTYIRKVYIDYDEYVFMKGRTPESVDPSLEDSTLVFLTCRLSLH